MATETNVIHMCFCRIKFLACLVLSYILRNVDDSKQSEISTNGYHQTEIRLDVASVSGQ